MTRLGRIMKLLACASLASLFSASPVPAAAGKGSVSGEVTASGQFSNIRANTVSGDMSFDLHGFTHDFGANSVSGDLTVRVPYDVGVDIVAQSASGPVVIDDRKYGHPGGKVETISGPDAKLMLVRTNSVSGKTSIFHGQAPATTEPAL